MPPIRGWFRSRKPLSTRQRLPYYQDAYGEKNPDEDLQGVHISADESDTDPEILGGKGTRRARNNSKPNGRAEVMETGGDEEAAQCKPFDRNTVVTIDDDSDVDELFVSDLRKYALSSIDESNEDGNDGNATANLQDQDEVSEAILEEIREYAQPPENKSQTGELGKTRSETSDDAAEQQSSPQLIDLTSPARSGRSEDEVMFLDHDQTSKLTIGQTSGEDDAFMWPKPQVDSSGKMHKRFGMFASQPLTADNEAIDLTGEEAPQKKSPRSILNKRRRDKGHRDTPTQAKRSRYNLRPRSEMAASTEAPFLSSDDEPKRALSSRRKTRSMAAKKKEKRIIPRHKAARKSAWAAMGLTTDEDTSRPRRRQTVHMDIPRKHMIAGKEIKIIGSDSDESVPRRGRLMLEMVLID